MAYESTAVTTPDDRLLGTSEKDGLRITRNTDGTITVEGPTVLKARIPRAGDFDENLADALDDGALTQIASRLVEFSKVDRESRKDWEDRERNAMDMLGLRATPQEESGKGDTENGHDVTHPMLMEATVRFQANAIVEVFPPDGPAETKVVGQKTPQKLQRAKRIRTFLNHYLTDVDTGYFDDTDMMLMYLPMGGSAFRRAGIDFTTGLPTLRHVKATNFIAPYAGTDLKSMPRYAWDFTMTGEDIDSAMNLGLFRVQDLPMPAPGDASHAVAADRSDDRIPTVHERDRLYRMLEYHVDMVLNEDPYGGAQQGSSVHDPLGDRATYNAPQGEDTGKRPYIVVVDADNERVLMIRRNWKQPDPTFKKRIWFAHHKFLPGLGFYGWGYPHVIGSLGRAASGAVNALLDAALAANFQGGFATKEARIAGEIRLQHGVWKQVDASAEDLAKAFYTPPFKEPSPALFQLLGALVEAGQRFGGTTDAAVGDGTNAGPVGTTVALIQQAQKPINAIHKRLHVSMSQELQMLGDLIGEYIPQRYSYAIGDEPQELLKSDFAPGVGIYSVTDPAISSDTQRVMRAQAILALQKEAPDLYPPQQRAEAHRRMLVSLKVPDVDGVGPVVKGPMYLDPVSENAEMFAGKPVRVFPAQDDKAHLEIHQDAIQRAQALFPPALFQSAIMPAMEAHIRDHLASSYRKAIFGAAGITPTYDADGNPVGLNPQAEAQITARVVQAITRLPKPSPPPGSPPAEQLAAQAQAQAKTEAARQQMELDEQAFQAGERRKQIAFENEEARKDRALIFQEARDAVAAKNDLDQQAAGAVQKMGQNAAQHTQSLALEARAQAERLAQQRDASLPDGPEGELQAERQAIAAGAGAGTSQAALQAGDKLEQSAATTEGDADAHTGVT